MRDEVKSFLVIEMINKHANCGLGHLPTRTVYADLAGGGAHCVCLPIHIGAFGILDIASASPKMQNISLI